jgi:hypothetical protein
MTSLQRIARHFGAGHLAEAEALIHAASDEGQRAGQGDAPLYHAIHLFQLHYEQGRLAEAETTLMDTLGRATGLPATKAMLAVLHSEQGRSDAVRAQLDELGAIDFSDLQLEASWVVALCYCAVAASAISDRDRAAALMCLLSPYPDHIAVFAVGLGIGCVAHYLGILATTMGELDQANTYFAAAAATHVRIAAPTWLARTRFDWARMLLTRRAPGDAERAWDLLDQTLSTAGQLGLARLGHQVAALLHDRS